MLSKIFHGAPPASFRYGVDLPSTLDRSVDRDDSLSRVCDASAYYRMRKSYRSRYDLDPLELPEKLMGARDGCFCN